MRRNVTLAVIATAICMSTAAFAQNVLVNGDFESNPPPNFGNNIGWSISPWVLGIGNASNVVKVDGPGGFNYGSSGPESDASAPGAGVPQHYLDIANGSNDFYQSFTPQCSGQVVFGGSFSTRANLIGTAAVTLRVGVGTSGSIVGTSTVNLPVGNSQTDPWTLVSFTAPINALTTYSFVVSMDNNMNFDNGFATYQVACNASPGVPTISEWGMILLALSLLTLGTWQVTGRPALLGAVPTAAGALLVLPSGHLLRSVLVGELVAGIGLGLYGGLIAPVAAHDVLGAVLAGMLLGALLECSRRGQGR